MATPTNTARNIPLNMAANMVEATIKYITDTTTTLKPYEQVVRLTVTANFTVNLPDPTECAGRIFTFFVEARSGNACTLSDGGNSRDFGGDYTLDAANDSIVLYCDGIKWHALNNEIA